MIISIISWAFVTWFHGNVLDYHRDVEFVWVTSAVFTCTGVAELVCVSKLLGF